MMKRFTDFLLFLVFYFIRLISLLLTHRLRIELGKFIGFVLRILSSKRQRITIDNIKLVYPHKNELWRKNVMKAAYRNLGITAVEILILNKIVRNNIEKFITYENIELIHKLYDEGRGLMLMSGHYGNWELLAYSAGIYTGYPITIVVKSQANFYINKMINNYRTCAGNVVVQMDMAAKAIVDTLKQKKIVALLADQSPFGGRGIVVDFLGIPSLTFGSPAIIALKYNVPVIMGFAVRNEKNVYNVHLVEIPHNDLRYDTECIKELTQRHVKILEEAVRHRPDLWAWQHRRWKFNLNLEI